LGSPAEIPGVTSLAQMGDSDGPWARFHWRTSQPLNPQVPVFNPKIE
jgi:hypothetical protein